MGQMFPRYRVLAVRLTFHERCHSAGVLSAPGMLTLLGIPRCQRSAHFLGPAWAWADAEVVLGVLRIT